MRFGLLLLVPMLFGEAREPARPATRHVVRMVGNGFQPRELTIVRGDSVRFVLVSGGPHNAAFRDVTGEAAARLRARMGKDTLSDLSGPLLVITNEVYEIVFTDVPSGRYQYWCVPHIAGGMTGTIIVK